MIIKCSSNNEYRLRFDKILSDIFENAKLPENKPQKNLHKAIPIEVPGHPAAIGAKQDRLHPHFRKDFLRCIPSGKKIRKKQLKDETKNLF